MRGTTSGLEGCQMRLCFSFWGRFGFTREIGEFWKEPGKINFCGGIKMLKLLRRNWSIIGFGVLAISWIGLASVPCALASPQGSQSKHPTSYRDEIKNVQKKLQDQGDYHGHIDGLEGPQTRAAIRQYQRVQHLPVNGRLDAATAAKLGVPPVKVRRRTRPVESRNLKSAGHSLKKGGKELGHEVKRGKPVAGAKDLGKSIGHAGKQVGKAAKKAVSTH
jgi:hypothetical protein